MLKSSTKHKIPFLFLTSSPVIKHKTGLHNLAKELSNVPKACEIMSISRDTFYRYRELADEGGIDVLINRSRRAPNLKNRIDDATKQAVVDYAAAFPAQSQYRNSNELYKQNVFISGSGVQSILLCHFRELYKTAESTGKKVACEGIKLTDNQIAALERKASDDRAYGQIETAHPGYLGSQDTFYTNNLK